MKTAKEIIEETVSYYSEDVTRRAVTLEVDGSGEVPSCAYYAPNGNMCAVGRCMIDAKATQDKHGNRGIAGVMRTANGEENVLKPEYCGHEPRLWDWLQNLHDFGANWNDGGLSAAGKREYKVLLGMYS